VNFKCKECGASELEEIAFNCVVASDILDVVQGELVGELFAEIQYGEQATDYGEVERYQCKNCECKISPRNADELFEFLKQKHEEE
jgi:hypothetical protein